jgi:predicted nucleotidyltransferase
MVVSILQDDAVLADIVERLLRAFEPEQTYLFGSKARNEAGRDSDYDLMVIVGDDVPPERRRSRHAYEVLRGTGVAAHVIVCTQQRFTSRLHVAASLSATIAREGTLLYDKRSGPGC